MDLIATPLSLTPGTEKDGWVANCSLKKAIYNTNLYHSIVYISYLRAWDRDL